MPSVLLTSTGRRGYLVGYFKEALAGRGRVLAANSTANAPGLQEADQSFLLPQAQDESFGPELIKLCAAEDVRLLLSLHDWEAPWIAPLIPALAEVGTVACVPNSRINQICLDKLETARWAESKGIRTPRTTRRCEEALAWKPAKGWVVKPRFGQGSVGMLMVTNPLLLPPACQMIREQLEAMTPPRLPGVEDICEVIVSERVEGPEFGVDLVNDLEGQPAGQIYKEKLGMRAGETDAAVTRRPSAELAEFGRNLATALAHPGQCDTDIILTEEGPTLIEMNPRFGGHYPFSHLAGADVPKFLVDLAWSGSADLGLLEVEENRMFGKIIGFRELTREDDRSNV